VFKYNKSNSFRSVAPPGKKHGQAPKAKNEVENWLKYNLEDKKQKKNNGKGFERNNYSKQDNLIKNSSFF
jgi:hypothetical protein